MKLLLKNIRVVDSNSPFDKSIVDIALVNGVIQNIGTNINEADFDEVFEKAGQSVSIGWCDMRVHATFPGFEHKEEAQTLAKAAVAGGFTDIGLLPNTLPIIQSKDGVAYINYLSVQLPINFWPYAAATHNTDGKDINEMIDLHYAGSKAFTDGENAVHQPDTLIKIWQYLSQFNGLFMNRPEENKLSQYGQMHEGLTSNLLGLKGIPSVAEYMAIERDIKLLEYVGGLGKNFRYHWSTISSKESVKLIREAKAKGLSVTCDVALANLLYTDKNIETFDSNFKVNPPLRSQEDRKALMEGILDGTIDAIVSDHWPHDTESKHLEYDMADFGISSLEAFFGILNSQIEELDLYKILALISTKPRAILQIGEQVIMEKRKVDLTIFDPKQEWIFENDKTFSKGKNNPFEGEKMIGKVAAVVVNGQLTYV